MRRKRNKATEESKFQQATLTEFFEIKTIKIQKIIRTMDPVMQKSKSDKIDLLFEEVKVIKNMLQQLLSNNNHSNFAVALKRPVPPKKNVGLNKTLQTQQGYGEIHAELIRELKSILKKRSGGITDDR